MILFINIFHRKKLALLIYFLFSILCFALSHIRYFDKPIDLLFRSKLAWLLGPLANLLISVTMIPAYLVGTCIAIFLSYAITQTNKLSAKLILLLVNLFLWLLGGMVSYIVWI